MFRELRRKNQQLSETEARSILKNGTHGVLSVQGDDGYPYGVPMNYVYGDDAIYFHCAKEGHKLEEMCIRDRWNERYRGRGPEADRCAEK